MYSDEQIEKAWKSANDLGINFFSAVGNNAKTIKSDKKTNYLTRIMYLAPSNQAGEKYNVCPMASKGCREACLYTSGHGAMQSVKDARIKRTKFWFNHREEFKACVYSELLKHCKICDKLDRTPAFRFNGTSDIVIEKMWPELFEHFPNITFYDYTKLWPRLMSEYVLPKNYHLTLSRSETNQTFIDKVIKDNPKANIAAVFDEIPKTWMGRKVIIGDEHDLRAIDPKGVIVGLKMKGDGRKDETGFVIRGTPLTVKGRKLQLV